MATNMLKCNSCNVVINEVLAFICNKIDVMDEESINRICVSAFSETEVKSAKDLLFQSVATAKRKKTRKRDGKTLRDIDDIICLLKETNPEEIPVFVARDLQKLPPVLFDHVDVTRLLKDLLRMQSDINQIREEYATVEHLQAIKSEVGLLKSTVCASPGTSTGNKVNNLDNTTFTEENKSKNTNVIPVSQIIHTKIAEKNFCNKEIDLQNEGEHKIPSSRSTHLACSPRPARAPLPRAPVPSPPVPVMSLSQGHTDGSNEQQQSQAKRTSFANIARNGVWKQDQRNEEWIKVQRNRVKNKFVGTRGKAETAPNTNFKAADRKIPVYIYNVAKDVTVCDILDYIASKTNVEVSIEKMQMTLAKEYDSYKIFVPGKLHNRAILVFSVYMPTNSVDNLVEFTQCLCEINAIIENNSVESVFMLGDFNAHPVKHPLLAIIILSGKHKKHVIFLDGINMYAMHMLRLGSHIARGY
ncbi:uncharacterized protein LOC111354602 [Spodoptera litura]|uniref:Uncharacterized protein LOC111354602 n=1 Tax=Spodoptera litura TaxID=69820 RepID=A0A9J7E7Z3_SPOLT|nr:uncharacterized protein LOC111354602 [Spodoptera litura]